MSDFIATMMLLLSLFSSDGGDRPDSGPSLERMVGQMLIVGFKGRKPGQPWPRLIVKQLKQGQIGGVVFLKRNIRSKRQVRRLTAAFAAANRLHPAFVAVDQEGGRVQRLSRRAGFRRYSSASVIARRFSPRGARRIYGLMADELADAGFNLNFGPVVDLALNRANRVVGRARRTYGRDPEKVTAYARAFVEAHRDRGVATSLKHFPGHGSSRRDSHHGRVDITNTWEPEELEPFASMIAGGHGDMVMVGHLVNAGFTPMDDAPMTLADGGISETLRGELAFGGVVITDDLNMGAIRRHYPLKQTVLKAIQAGNDILLFSNTARKAPALPGQVLKIVREAVAAGSISRARLRASYDRIIALKGRLRARRAGIE